MTNYIELKKNSLAENSLKYYLNNYNCAESILHGANDFYKLNLDKNSLKLMGGFGGGMQIGSLCGTIAAAISTISALVVKTCAHDTPELSKIVSNFWTRFDNEFDSRDCEIIRNEYFQSKKRCSETVIIVSNILEKTLEDFGMESRL